MPTEGVPSQEGRYPPLGVLLDELNTDLDQCLQYTRTLVRELCPTALYQTGLVGALQQLALEFEKYDLHITVVAEESHIPLSEDTAILMYQTVRELLFNVLKHAKTNRAQVRVRTTPHHAVEVIVEDKGSGFDPAILLTRSAQGFGLLSIRERIESLSGLFDVQSAPGVGTTTTIALPVTSVPDDRPSSTGGGVTMAVEHGGSVVTSSSEGAITVLLVDDHAIVRQGLRSVLDAYPDIEIVGEACNGEEAVNAAHHLRPSIVVMDINMPKMDGIAATQHITSQYPDVVVVGLSVNAGDDSTTAILTAGAVALIAKEAAVDQLYPTIQNALRAKRANI
jgi:CheY-like chemotaxis protein